MKYFLFSITLLSAAVFFTQCKKDDKTEEENITRVVMHLTAIGFDQEFEAKATNGDDIWDHIDTIQLPSLTGDITCQIHVYDDTQTPAEDITEEIESENDVHIFTFKVNGADLSIQASDQDKNGKPFNLKTLWETGDAGMGSVQVRLHHEPVDKNAVEPGGDIDFDVSFQVKIQ